MVRFRLGNGFCEKFFVLNLSVEVEVHAKGAMKEKRRRDGNTQAFAHYGFFLSAVARTRGNQTGPFA